MSDSHTNDLSIAIIGMAGRFPGAAGVEQLWRNLREGVESIEFFAESEREGSFTIQADDPGVVRAGGVLDDIEGFDAAFFDFNPREAEITDPQQRLFLECCWEALERAGYDPQAFSGSIGVFAGAGLNGYFFNNVLAHPELFRTVTPYQIMVGTDKDYLAPRVSYKLNLRGPSVSVQTACSTSLVAIHLACQSLQDFQSDMALAGGVSIRIPQRSGYRYTEGGIYSPDGHCRAFDRQAGGTVSGSGAGVVVLKRLEDALADGDEVLAVIRGSAINNDGAAKVGFTAPSVEGQAAVIAEALSVAGVEPESIGYVEAHGTGTALGDPIEITALNRAFGLGDERRESCAIGSVKSNLGHLDTASGVAGLIKTVLALRHEAIPASLHFEAPNPEIDFAAGPFYVNASLRDWKPNGAPRRAGVSSFGIGGTNAHAIVEEAPRQEPSGPSRDWQLLLISARTPTALETATDNLARHLEENPEQPLADVAFTAQVGRRAFKHRRALVVHGREDAVAALRSRDPHRTLTLAQEDRERPVAFLFPGQGAQYPNMGRDLYESEPAFRKAIDACASALQPHLGLDLRTVLYPEGDPEAEAARLEQTALAQPALFTVEYALAELLREWGIRPAAMIGHSIGEYVAACLAGVFSLRDALALVAVRGRLMQGLPSGAMLVVPRPEEEARKFLADGLALAAVNGPSFSVISGPVDRVEDLARRLAAEGIEGRRLHTSHAFHSGMMDPVLEEFHREVEKVRLSAPKVPYLSNLTGTWIEDSQATDPAYWVRHLRETVRFADGAAELLRDRSRVLLEVGPGRTLASLVRSAASDRTVVTSMRHPQDGGDGNPLAGALARLWLAGAPVDWSGFHAHERRRRVLLPTYPFERQRFWLEPAQMRAARPQPELAETGVADAAVEAAPPAPKPQKGYPRPELATPFVAPTDEIEAGLATLWGLALGLAEVGVHDDFFELGGHSLLATQISAEVKKSFGIDVSLRALFEKPTVAGLAAVVREARQATAGEEAPAAALPAVVADPARRHEPFPLTDVQQAYWVGRSGAFELGQVATHIYREINVRGIDIQRVERAWRRMIERHDMLRAIVLPDGRQQILETVPPYRIEILDLRDKDASEQAPELERVRRQMSHQVLPADRWPLFEVRATRLDETRTRFHVSFDFLIGDAWSWQILNRDLLRFYRDPEAAAPASELSFRDYVLAIQEFERTAAFERDLAYWRGRLADLPPAPELPLVKSPAALGRPHFVRHSGVLSRSAWSRLKERASRAGLTPSGVLLAAFSEVLAAWSKSPRFTINLTLFNRLPIHPQVNELVGDFTSLTLLAVDASGTRGFEERAKRIQSQLWEDLDHRSVSGVRVVRELARTQGGLARAAMPVVFTSTLNQVSRREDEDASRPEGEDRQKGEGNYEISQTPQVWIDHQVTETRGRLTYNWDVVEELFPAGFLQTMFDVYQRLLERLAGEEEAWGAHPAALLPEDQLAQRVEANATSQAFGPAADELLHTLMAPPTDRPAVAAPGRTLTYRDLHRRAAFLGHRLREAGARPNTLIGVVMEKGWEQVVGTLGILGSGAAYLPIDPDLPADRRHYLLENGGVEMVVTQPWIDDRIAEAGEWPEGVRRFRVEAEEPEGDVEPLAAVQKPEDLAYVIYTSGSTGQPKGVVIDHRGAVNTILDLNHRFQVGPEDRVFALSSLSFDLSVYDIFGTLAAGGTIVFPEAGRRRDPEHWAERIESEGVTLWNSVPALMEMLTEQAAGRPGDVLPGTGTIRLVFLSGDWIPVSLPGRIRTLPYVTPGIEVISMGGATEASIWSIIHPIGTVDSGARSIPYGRPMANQTFHVLDDRLRPRPTWVPGHLYIGGVGLAKGYWRDPEKTAASFITHPATGERLYRTGDLGRYLPSGDIEFLGREDSQVKIRGYRVELGEIESTLAKHSQVRDSAVVARDGGRPGEKRLNAYVVAEPDSGLDVAALKDFLRERLPEYMVPSAFLFLDALPLTANGKVDRRALPVFDQDAVQSRREYVAPRTEIEEGLANIFAEVLGIEKVGIYDDFFEVGGDSLMAIRALFKIRKSVGVDLQVKTFFDTPTVALLAEAVEEMILDQIENMSDEEVHELL